MLKKTFAIVFSLTALALAKPYNGTGKEVMLQAFDWFSYGRSPVWYQTIAGEGPAIRSAGFDCVWFPPPSASAAGDNSYLPTQWDDLNNGFGKEAQLKAAIASLKPEAFAICDLVLNHRCGKATAGADFEEPSFGTSSDNRQAVVNEDESGIGEGPGEQTHRDQSRCSGMDGGRDLNHHSSKVQSRIHEFLQRLEALGFQGWRYDMTKGYNGFHVGAYNDASHPRLSVGEYADDRTQAVVDWIDETGGRSMAFDFPSRRKLVDALQSQDFSHLKTLEGKPPGVIGMWPEMAVTFVENHDCQPGHETVGERFPQGRLMQGYAYILTHPGIPCVFWPHYFAQGDGQREQIGKLIRLRREAGITSKSNVFIEPDTSGKYAAFIEDKVAVKIGPAPWSPGNGWTVVVSGPDYAVWKRS